MESLHKWLEENMFYCKSNLFEAIYHNPGELKADPNIGKTSYVGSNEGANSNNILVSNKE
ncbi:41223_t:CDS:2, partial [Gigaspora margarita]